MVDTLPLISSLPTVNSKLVRTQVTEKDPHHQNDRQHKKHEDHEIHDEVVIEEVTLEERSVIKNKAFPEHEIDVEA